MCLPRDPRRPSRRPGGRTPHAGWRHFIPSVTSRGPCSAYVSRYDAHMQPRLAPGRIYAQAISAWALLHPAAPLSPFCRKCNIHVPIGASNFSLVYNTHLALGDQPLGSSFLNFGPMHLTRASEIRAVWTPCQCRRPSVLQRLDVHVDDAKVRPAICCPGVPRRERPHVPLRCQCHSHVSSGVVF